VSGREAWWEVAVEKEIDVRSIKDIRKFEVHCNAGDAGELRVGTESLSVKFGQRVRRDGSEEMWHSVLIHCDEAIDGCLTIKVIVCHFDWDESRQIAMIQSKPNHREGTRTLTFDLEQEDV
jgi:hypothetical protein